MTPSLRGNSPRNASHGGPSGHVTCPGILCSKLYHVECLPKVAQLVQWDAIDLVLPRRAREELGGRVRRCGGGVVDAPGVQLIVDDLEHVLL